MPTIFSKHRNQEEWKSEKMLKYMETKQHISKQPLVQRRNEKGSKTLLQNQ